MSGNENKANKVNTSDEKLSRQLGTLYSSSQAGPYLCSVNSIAQHPLSVLGAINCKILCASLNPRQNAVMRGLGKLLEF